MKESWGPKNERFIWETLNRPFFYVANCNRNRIRAVLERGSKETAILNSSDFGLTLLYMALVKIMILASGNPGE